MWLCSLPSAAGRRGQCGTGSGRSWSWGSPPDLLLGKVGGPVLHLAPLPQPLGGVGALSMWRAEWGWLGTWLRK